MTFPASRGQSALTVYWTAFVGLFFDYYDLYLFVYLEKVLAGAFQLSTSQSNALQFSGVAGIGLGALGFGYLADRLGRERVLLASFAVYVGGLLSLSLAWDFNSLLCFRVIASLALGAEWGISHTWMTERVAPDRRYRFAALLQFAILGGLLAAMANRYLLSFVGWRGLFALSVVPVAVLSMLRWRWLSGLKVNSPLLPKSTTGFADGRFEPAPMAFLRCLALASLTIASGYINVFFVKELPQSPVYTVLFWVNVAPGMLAGSLIVRWLGVRLALLLYAVALITVSLLAWQQLLPGGKLGFALLLPLLNGIPFGLMGAYFNEVFVRYRTMLSGSAYNIGRIAAGFAPFVITALGLHERSNYFLFSAALGVGVLCVGWGIKSPAGNSPV